MVARHTLQSADDVVRVAVKAVCFSMNLCVRFGYMLDTAKKFPSSQNESN